MLFIVRQVRASFSLQSLLVNINLSDASIGFRAGLRESM